MDDQKEPWEHIKNKQIQEDIYPIRADYLIIGGGIMGAAVAYWLGQFHLGCEIVVVEKDPSFTQVVLQVIALQAVSACLRADPGVIKVFRNPISPISLIFIYLAQMFPHTTSSEIGEIGFINTLITPGSAPL